MTQIRCCACERCDLSNYFDALLKDAGHRGSSFSDLDAVSHDAGTGRFLIQEFKHAGEALVFAQHWMLRGLAGIPAHFRVWLVVRRDDGLIDFAQLAPDCRYTLHTITPEQYREIFCYWWENRRHPLIDAWRRTTTKTIP